MEHYNPSHVCDKLLLDRAAVVNSRVVLVAVDESDESIYALTWALNNVLVAGFDMAVLLHVETPVQAFIVPAGPGFYITPDIIEAQRRHQKDISSGILCRSKTLCDKKQVESKGMISVGDAREEICDAVEKLCADLLLLGSHGYGRIKRAMLGSVSDYCAHKAKCPVVIVKKS